MSSRQKYLRNNDLRAEIAYRVGKDPTRYQDDARRSLTKEHVVSVAEVLQPADSDFDIYDADLGPLYERVCAWAGAEYTPNAGNPWGLNRPALKAIHEAVDAQPLKEVVVV